MGYIWVVTEGKNLRKHFAVINKITRQFIFYDIICIYYPLPLSTLLIALLLYPKYSCVKIIYCISTINNIICRVSQNPILYINNKQHNIQSVSKTGYIKFCFKSLELWTFVSFVKICKPYLFFLIENSIKLFYVYKNLFEKIKYRKC